jgi:hypothetical protein
MKHLKKFNEEIRIVKSEGSEPDVDVKKSSYNTPGTKIIKIEAFDEVASKILQKQMSLGLKPFYLNKDNEFVEILIDDKGFPYESIESERANRYGRPISSRKNSFKWKANHYGEVYLLTDEDLKSIQPLLGKVRGLINKLEEQKQLLVKLIGSKLTHKDENIEEL